MGTMNKKILVAIGAVAIVIVVALIFLYRVPSLMLVAEGEVSVYVTKNDAMESLSPSPIAVLSERQSIKVTRCVDVKHYFIYKVRLADGRIGFVNAGKYSIQRDGKPAHC